jgi:hypothetical protein
VAYRARIQKQIMSIDLFKPKVGRAIRSGKTGMEEVCHQSKFGDAESSGSALARDSILDSTVPQSSLFGDGCPPGIGAKPFSAIPRELPRGGGSFVCYRLLQC